MLRDAGDEEVDVKDLKRIEGVRKQSGREKRQKHSVYRGGEGAEDVG